MIARGVESAREGRPITRVHLAPVYVAVARWVGHTHHSNA
jgi:hypothetical protein